VFLDIAFHGRVAIFTIDRTQLLPVQIQVNDGFVPVLDAQCAFGNKIVGQAEEGAPGIHLVDIFVRIIRRDGVWRGKILKAELRSLIQMVAMHFEVSLSFFNLVPLRQLEEVPGRGERVRHVADVQRKEELMQLAARVGAALTATRLNLAFRAFQQKDTAAPEVPGHARGPADSPAGVQYQFAGKVGACAYFAELELVPVITPVKNAPQRDQTDFEGQVMQQYAHGCVTSFPGGPLHVALDGVQCKTSGEVNQYFVSTPARPGEGVQETSAWLPIQVALGISMFY
jgi:hypothetical protein